MTDYVVLIFALYEPTSLLFLYIFLWFFFILDGMQECDKCRNNYCQRRYRFYFPCKICSGHCCCWQRNFSLRVSDQKKVKSFASNKCHRIYLVFFLVVISMHTHTHTHTQPWSEYFGSAQFNHSPGQNRRCECWQITVQYLHTMFRLRITNGKMSTSRSFMHVLARFQRFNAGILR